MAASAQKITERVLGEMSPDLADKISKLLSPQRNMHLPRRAMKQKLASQPTSPTQQTRLSRPLCTVVQAGNNRTSGNPALFSGKHSSSAVLFHHGYPDDYLYRSAFTLKPAGKSQQNDDMTGELGWGNKGNLVFGTLVNELGFLRRLHPSIEYDKSSDCLKYILPAIYNATGLIPALVKTDDGYALTEAQDALDLEALLADDDVMSAKQVSFNKRLMEFTRKAYTVEYEELQNGRGASSKAHEMLALSDTLKLLTRNFFMSYKACKNDVEKLTSTYNQFVTEFSDAVSSNAALDERRGYDRMLLHFALCFVAGFGFATTALDYGTLLITGKPLFCPDTNSRILSQKLVRDLSEALLPEELLAARAGSGQ